MGVCALSCRAKFLGKSLKKEKRIFESNQGKFLEFSSFTSQVIELFARQIRHLECRFCLGLGAMSTGTYIRKFLNSIDEGQMFSISEFTGAGIGSRKSIDCAFSELVKNSRIVNVAFGMYMKGDDTLPVPPVLDIVRERAKRMGWDLIPAPDNPIVPDPHELTFYITGNSTSFRVKKTTVHIKAISPKKFQQLRQMGKPPSIKDLINGKHYLAIKSGSSASTRSANFFNRLKE